ncbi:hypothetical protein HPB50_019666 [Hyalomma asiaticum]|uniref:Uncharacterized protein n=1 Tax=Hyalomma asiaticum TaxID=266040 RepID=A0ACB7TKE2_HYAAI|nr:hypothetical protein HPB50_019666 [Hyalomma asiaticum]
MSRPRNRTAKKSTTSAEEGMVQCSSCEGWTCLEDTPFANLDEASDKTYTCRLCTKISALYATLALQEKTMRADFNLQISSMKAQWEEAEATNKKAMEKILLEINTERALRKELSEKLIAHQAELEKQQIKPMKCPLTNPDAIDKRTDDP